MCDFDVEMFTLDYQETPTSLVECLITIPPKRYQVCKVTECLTTSEACKLMSRDWFGVELSRKFPSLVAIRFEVTEKINVKQAKQPRSHEFSNWSRVLISYESMAENKKVICWRNINGDDFIGIELGNEGESMILGDFVMDFLIEALVGGRTVTLASSPSPLTNLIDSFKTNLLIKSILDQNQRVFRELLKLPFDINHAAFVNKNRFKTSAADIAYIQKDFNILFELLSNNSMYPTSFDINEVDLPAIKALVKLSTDLHEAIKENNKEKVIEILQKNSNLRHFYDTSNVSAIATALKSKNIELYKVLLDHDVAFGPLEDVSGILKRYVPKEMRKDIRDLNSTVAKGLADRHLMTIFAKSVIAYDNQCNKEATDLVKKALRDLNEIKIGHDLLLLSAHNEKLKIHFDFNQKSIMRMDPVNGSAGTSGVFYSHKAHVYVAAKDSGGTRNLIAVLAHELCHLAVNLVFRNGVDPYAADDEARKKEFAEIISKCQKVKDKEDIVNWVFECYPKDEWPAELIVRVPHMLVFHHGNVEKIREIRETFRELFEYFESFVAPLMMRTVVLLDKIARKSFSVNCAVLTDPLKNAIYESTIEFQGHEIEFSEIVDRDSEVFNYLKHSQMKEILNCTEVLKIGRAPIMEEFYVERSFIDFEVDVEWEENGEWSQTVKNNLVNFKKIAMAARSSNLILISDHAGAGKSMTLRNLAAKLNNKYTDHWVAYIELMQHLRIYEKLSKSGEKIERNLVVEVLKEILGLSDELESAVFTSLFNSNQVILLLDGFDEISPRFTKFFMNLIQFIRNESKNQLWISTRPQHMKDLKLKFKQRPFKLLPFDDKERKEFIEQISPNKIVQNVSEIIKTIDNPQLLKVIVQLPPANLLTTFEAFVESYKNTLIKKRNELASSERDPDGKLNIWQVMQVNALKLIFKDQFPDLLKPQKFIKLSEISLIKKYQNGKHKWTPEAIARYGFLYIENWDCWNEIPHFVHQSFAEFFVAKFLIENIFEADDDDVSYEHMVKRMKLLMFVVEREEGEMRVVMSFLRDYFEKMMREIEFKRTCSNLQQGKKFNIEIYNFMKSEKMQNFIGGNDGRVKFWKEMFG